MQLHAKTVTLMKRLEAVHHKWQRSISSVLENRVTNEEIETPTVQ